MSNWALIIGGSSGIGLATARKLAKNRFNVICVHRDRRSATDTFLKEIAPFSEQITALNFDATNSEKIDQNMEVIKGILGTNKVSVMVHSLSRGNLKPLFSNETPSLTDQDMDLTMEAMGFNILSWTRKLVSANLFHTNARIISLTSAGSNKAWTGYAAVGVAKAALETITKYMAVELAPLGIRCNTINAGITDTPSLNIIPNSKELKEKAISSNPYKRLTRTEDVANAIYLLTLPEADWINGSLIHVDGGEHLIG